MPCAKVFSFYGPYSTITRRQTVNVKALVEKPASPASEIEKRQMDKNLNTLTKNISREPFEGIGKPEPLKYAL